MTATTLSAPVPVERALQFALTAALAALGVFAPFSTAGTSIALAVLLLIALAMAPRVWRLQPWRQPVFAVGLALLVYIGVRSMAAAASPLDGLKLANRYHELLMIPVLWTLMQLANGRRAFLMGLLAGSLFLAVLHWIPLPDYWTNKVELRRISAGFGLAVCAFVFFEEARLKQMPRTLGYGAAASLAITVLFAAAARTGYVVLLLMIACAAWRATPRKWRWAAFVMLVAAALLVGSVYSSLREKRGDTAISNQIRAELLYNTLEVVREHWAFGTGWATYPQAYADIAAKNGAPPDAHWAQSENPHNEYLMQAAAGGVPALAMFLAWIGLPMAAALWRRAATDDTTGSLACVALAFAVGSLFNSLLLDFTEGHLYGALMAWLMAQREAAA